MLSANLSLCSSVPSIKPIQLYAVMHSQPPERRESADGVRLKEVLRGDEQAIAQLWLKLAEPLRMMARKHLGAGRHLQNSEDIRNMAFMSFLRTLQKIESGEGFVAQDEQKSWDYTVVRLHNELIPLALGIAKRIALEANRSELAAKRGGRYSIVSLECDEKGSHTDPLVALLVEEQFELLKNHVRGNPQLETIVARLADDIPARQIAHELGISPASVSRRVRELRRVLEHYEPFSDRSECSDDGQKTS